MPTYDSITIPYLLIVLVGMPVMGVRSYFRVNSGKPLPPKRRRHEAMMALQIFLLGNSLLVARQNGVRLWGNTVHAWIWIVAALYLVVIGIRLNSAWKRLSLERKRRARLVLPESSREMPYWAAISILAGLSEECAFRGMAYIALREITGSAALSLTVCVIAFAAAHLLQGWRGVLGTGVIALLMHWIVSVTQGLYLAIGIHAAYDLMVGIIAMRAFMRDDALPAIEAQRISAGG